MWIGEGEEDRCCSHQGRREARPCLIVSKGQVVGKPDDDTRGHVDGRKRHQTWRSRGLEQDTGAFESPRPRLGA